MKQIKTELFETDLKNQLGQEILKDSNNVLYKLVNGRPQTLTINGEPERPIGNYTINPMNDSVTYDLGDYTHDFDLELYGQEKKSWKGNNWPNL